MDEKRKNKIAFICAFAGGGVFCVLNIVTRGAVPGGFVGGPAHHAFWTLLAHFRRLDGPDYLGRFLAGQAGSQVEFLGAG